MALSRYCARVGLSHVYHFHRLMPPVGVFPE